MHKSLKGINRKACILVVDDDSSLLKFFKIHLTSVFANVRVVENVEEAFEVMKQKDFELILSDIKLPKISGIDFIQQVKTKDASIVTYAVSAYYDGSEKQLKYIDGFLKKPFDIDVLNDMIISGLRLRKYFLQLASLLEDNALVLSLVYEQKLPDGYSLDEKTLKQATKLSEQIREARVG